MYSKRSGCISKEASTGRSTCRVEGRCKCPRLMKAGDHLNFDIIIVNLAAVSYLRMTPEQDIAKAEKEKKDL